MDSLPKTLIGKNNILFLINDGADELKVHCENLLKIQDINLSRYKHENTYLFIYPNKSLIYKEYLPDEYIFKYRPALEIYKNKFKNKIYDLYEILNYESDVYYKTDTHINVKGNCIVYKYFIEVLNSILHLNIKIKPKEIDLHIKTCKLNTLPYGIGDLTWETNLKNQELTDTTDNFYFNEELFFYCVYEIKNEKNIRFLDNNLCDKTSNLEDKIVSWDIISEYIIYKKNNNGIPLKVLIFYDSFLLNVLSLYFDIFHEIYLMKSTYSNDIIDQINPDYIFEFRVERFLF